MASRNRYTGLEPRTIALVHHHAKRLAASDHRLEQEDMEQDLFLHLHARAGRYASLRASRATYDDRVVCHRAADLARNARAGKRGPAAATVSLDYLLSNHDRAEGIAPLELLSETEAKWEDIAALRSDLLRFLASQPRRFQQCCQLLLLTYSVTETARTLQHQRSSIYAWLATLSARARSAGLGIYLEASPTDSAPAE